MSFKNHGPVLSVRLMTYNHENYIAEAIEGCLRQETNFDFEIVIGDDFSTDKTLSICKEFALKNPKKINLLHRPINGTYFTARKEYGRMYNYIDIINNCRGQYIALLDGDDYWIDNNKLQMQYDFMQSNPDIALCSTHFNTVYNTKIEEPMNKPDEVVYPKLGDILFRNPFGSLTVVLRKANFHFPEWVGQLPYFDWPLFTSIAENYKTALLPAITANYRKIDSGIFSNLGYFKQQTNRLLILQILVKKYGSQISEEILNKSMEEIYRIRKYLFYQSITIREPFKIKAVAVPLLSQSISKGNFRDTLSILKSLFKRFQ